MKRLVVGGALLAVTMLSGPGVHAQEAPEPPPVGVDQAFDARVRAIAVQLRCPVCLGNSIQDSPSELATDMRQLVREHLAAGKTEAEIKAYFVDRYGEWVLLNPQAHGFNLVVWFLPAVLLLGGGALLWRSVSKWSAAAVPTAPPLVSPEAAPTVEDEYLRKVRDEVAGRGR